MVVRWTRCGLYIFSVLMRRFLRKIVLYVLPIFLGAIILELVVERIPNSYTYKRAYMDRYADSICTLVLGHSCAYDGIDAEILPSAFNLANSSQCFEDDYRLLVKYLPVMDSLKMVVLPVSYSSLQMVSSSNRRTYYTIYMDIYPRWPISKYSFECFNLELLVKKCVKYLLNTDMVQCDSLGQRLGHTMLNRPIDWKETQSLIANDRFVGKSSIPYVTENIEWLHRLAELCENRDVLLYLVAMPMLPDYRSGMPMEQILLMEQVMRSMAQEHNCVRFVDYQEWGNEDDFWNATHLNTDGAKHFSIMLLHDLYNKKSL